MSTSTSYLEAARRPDVCGYCGSSGHTSLECQKATEPGRERDKMRMTTDCPHCGLQDHSTFSCTCDCHRLTKAIEYEESGKFWMVLVKDKSGPVHEHSTFDEARIEAVRLKKLPNNVGLRVYILKTVVEVKLGEAPIIYSTLK